MLGATVTAAMARAATLSQPPGTRAASVGLQALSGDMGSQGKASAFGWAGAEKGSRLSQLPHFQFKEIMKRRKRQQERLGPGTYNIRDFLQETRPSSLRGICDTREQRFRDAHRDCFPGPGTYGPRGNPYARLEERDGRSPLPPFPPYLQGSGPGPGTYRLRSSIDEGLRRRAGGLGPCQLFSGHRSKLGRDGHHASEVRTELSTGTVKGFLDELTLKENKKKGCFSTLPRNPGCPTERIFWATLSQCPREYAVGPGSYNPKPIERSAYSGQPPFWSSALPGFAPLTSPVLPLDGEAHETFSFQNPVGVGRYDITKHEKYPQKMRYQSLYRCDAQRYLSNLKQDAYLLKITRLTFTTKGFEIASMKTL
uniref:Ciliary microtubule associated protein 2 n=1 Tax=Aquila chrysaetos chrysaetos TaxID=223781 RepID=A0A663FLA6_AQUCH